MNPNQIINELNDRILALQSRLTLKEGRIDIFRGGAK